jgi:hypothetical protein
MTEEEIVDNLKNKIAEKGFYGTVDEKPPTEQDLFALQTQLFVEREEYKKAYEAYSAALKTALKTGKEPKMAKPVDHSKETWSKMLEIMYLYTRSCILKRNTKKRFMEPEDVADKAISAALAFMSQYNKNPDFYVGASFAGMVKWKIVEALYKYQTEDDHLSLNQIISDDGQKEIVENMTYEDNAISSSSSDYLSPEELAIAQDSGSVYDSVVRELDAVIGHESKKAFLTRLYLLIILRGPRTRHSKRLFLEKWGKDHQTEQVLEASLLELHQRMLENCIA